MYSASIVGNDSTITQQLTLTPCHFLTGSCKPRESPTSRIVWFPVRHRPSLFRFLGKFPVKRVRDFILIAPLGVGGTILYKGKYSYFLDSGYKLFVVRSDNKNRVSPNATFDSLAYGYLSKTHLDVKADIREGHYVRDLLHSTETTLHLAYPLCTTNKNIRQLQRLLMNFYATKFIL